MSAQPRTQAAIADQSSARRIIEVLSRIHPLLLVYDARSTVRWISDGLGSLFRDAQSAVGRPLCAMLPKLPQGDQLEELRSRFEERGFLPSVRLELETRAGGRRPLEVSCLRLP